MMNLVHEAESMTRSTYHGFKRVIKENVGGLDVAVDDSRVACTKMNELLQLDEEGRQDVRRRCCTHSLRASTRGPWLILQQS